MEECVSLGPNITVEVDVGAEESEADGLNEG